MKTSFNQFDKKDSLIKDMICQSIINTFKKHLETGYSVNVCIRKTYIDLDISMPLIKEVLKSRIETKYYLGVRRYRAAWIKKI